MEYNRLTFQVLKFGRNKKPLHDLQRFFSNAGQGGFSKMYDFGIE